MKNVNSEFIHSHKFDYLDSERALLETQEPKKIMSETIHVNRAEQRGASLLLLNELNRNFLMQHNENDPKPNKQEIILSSAGSSVDSSVSSEKDKSSSNRSVQELSKSSSNGIDSLSTKRNGKRNSFNNTFDHLPYDMMPKDVTLNEEDVTPKEENRGKTLWDKARTKLLLIAKFRKMNKNLQLYGTSETGFDENKPKKHLHKLRRIQTEVEKEENGDKSQIKKKLKFYLPILLPNCTFMYFWNTILLLLMIYTALLMPFRIAFIDQDDSPIWSPLENVIDFLFLTDCLINFNLAFYNIDNYIVTSRKQIALEYIKSWFFIDIISSIPQNLLFNFNGFSKTDLLRLARLPKLYRLIKILRLIKLAKFFKQLTFIQKLEKFFNINFGVTKLLNFLFSTLIVAHVLACMWYMCPRIYDEYDNWVVNTGLIDESVFRLYLFSLYWTFTTLLTVGFGDIRAYNLIEYCISIVFMLFGVGFYSFFIGTLSSILVNIDTKENILKNKLIILEEFCHESQLPTALKEKIKTVLVYNSQKSVFTWSDKAEIFNELPANLKYEVTLCNTR
jgi:hypothetical protein